MTFQFAKNTPCKVARGQFAAYMDGALSGVAMGTLRAHLDACAGCAKDFEGLRATQDALGMLGRTPAPEDLQQRLRAAIAAERVRGTHLSWAQQTMAAWKAWLRPMAARAVLATAAAVVMVGGVSALLYGTPAFVEANDEPLGAVTAPHYLYSEVPPQPIDVGREVPILVEAKIDAAGRVFDYAIVEGPTDDRTVRRVQANLLNSRFQPATVFGVPVQGRVVMTYAGVSVRG